jgi:hypothetical protein
MGVANRPCSSSFLHGLTARPAGENVARGKRHTDLLASAAIHDVGKSRARLRLWGG